MANIKTHLNNIKGALYGKDVRGSIHDGIDAINKEVENTTGRQADLENTFDQLVINAGNSNAEIVDARVKNDGTSYSKLGDRLDAVDSQLAHIAIHINNFEYLCVETKVGDVTYKDWTNAINYVIENNQNKKIIFESNKTYYVDTIKVLSNTFIDFNGAIIEKIPTDKSHYKVIDITDVHDVTLIRPFIKGDRKNHIKIPSSNSNNVDGFSGEWGHGIGINGSKNINIHDAKVYDCWGDGVCISYSDNDNNNCDSINFFGTTLTDNCRRQGMSVIAGKNIYVDTLIAKNIKGTKPQQALDIEPNFNGLEISFKCNNVVSENCSSGVGIVMSSDKMDVHISDIKLINCDDPSLFFVDGEAAGVGESVEYSKNRKFNIGNVYIDKIIDKPVVRIFNHTEYYPYISINNIDVNEAIYNDNDYKKSSIVYFEVTFNNGLTEKYGYATINNINIHQIKGNVKPYSVFVRNGLVTEEERNAILFENFNVNINTPIKNYLSKDFSQIKKHNNVYINYDEYDNLYLVSSKQELIDNIKNMPKFKQKNFYYSNNVFDNDYFENANGSILVNKVNNDSAFLLILNNSNKTVYNCTVITSTGELTTIAPLYSHLSVRTVKSTTRPTVDIWRGYMVYDDDLQKPIWYSGNGVWKNANGDIV